MKTRIWELDALRGLALLGMIGIHLIYDLVDLFGILPWELPAWYLLFKNNYGAVFLLYVSEHRKFPLLSWDGCVVCGRFL